MPNGVSEDGQIISAAQVDAPLEWLAFRGLPLFPTVPRGTRVETTGVKGRGETMSLSWPLWSLPASLATVRSLLQLPHEAGAVENSARGVFAVCTSSIRRTKRLRKRRSGVGWVRA